VILSTTVVFGSEVNYVTEETMNKEPGTQEEHTLVIKDGEGNYYMLPVKHLPLDRVEPKEVEDLRRRLNSLEPISGTKPDKSEDINLKRAEYRVVGVYDFTKDVRRRFVPPQTSKLPDLKSPPS
jgi:hypothetical protein